MTQMAGPLQRYDDVTPAWMMAALSAKWPGLQIAAVRRGPIFGFKQNKFRVEVEYASGAEARPTSFIVKGNFPGQNDPSTGSAWAMEIELRSLRDIVPLLAAPAGPAWHHIDITDAASSILMEDLVPAGAGFFDAFHTLHLGQAMAFMDAFARMHAGTWNSATFAPSGEMGPGSFAAENRRLVNDVYFPRFFTPENWQSYVERPRGRALPNALQTLGRVHHGWKMMWAVLHQSAMVVIHGDEHLGNIFVTADGAPGLIDWVARPEHWPIGIAYFLVCCLDIQDRRRWERALLSHYATRLAHHGAQFVPAFEDMWFQYRCACLYPMVTWLNNSAIWQPEAVNTANTVRAAMAVLDHDVLAMLGA